MKIKRYNAKDMRTALAQVKEELGAEAVIMSNKKTANGIELVAAIDSDAAAPEQVTDQSTPSLSAPQANNPQSNAEQQPIASSLEELLKRQNAAQSSAKPAPAMNVNPATGYSPNKLTGAPQATLNRTPANTNAEMFANQPQDEKRQSNPMGGMTQALSQQAESEFEQWLSKARDKVVTGGEGTFSTNSNHAQEQEMDQDFAAPVFDNSLDGDDFTDYSEQNDALEKPTNNHELATLKAEMQSIKQLLEHQVSNLMWQDVNLSLIHI